MKIMIFGGAGFVASHLVDYCLKQGDDVICTIRWNEDLSRMKHFKDKVKIEYVEATDITSIIRAINKHRPDVISWLCAQSWVPYSFDNPIYTMQANVIGTTNLLESIRIIKDVENQWFEPNKKTIQYNPLIHICSSSEFYGKVKREDLPITENHKANPGNPYGVSKVAGDFMAQIYKEYYDMRIVITRMFTHTGVGRTMMSAENYYAKSVAEVEAGLKDSIEISDKKGMASIRTWADVRDAVKNYYNLFQSGKTGIYNIAGETEKSIEEVLQYLLDISDIEEEVEWHVNPKFIRKIDVDKQVVDITKFKESIDWTNDITFEELMKSLLDYWRKNV